MLQPSSIDIETANTITQEDIDTLVQDEKLQAIASDEEIKKAVESKDFGKLLSDPKIQSLLQDGAFVEKLLNIYNRALQENK